MRASAAVRRLAAALARAALVLATTLVLLWGTLALHFSSLPTPSLRTAAAALFGGGFALALLLWKDRRRTWIAFLLASGAVVAYWGSIPASNDRDWLPEYARTPTADIDGDIVTLHDVRDFEYRSETDFTPRYRDLVLDLRDLEAMDFIKSQWAGPDIVHTMLSFGFRGGQWITLSAETRREKGEPQTTLRGLYKQYELAYILAEERDVVRLRTTFRKEQVYVYPTLLRPEKVRAVFLDVLRMANDLARSPRFYNTVTHNCTVSLLPHLEAAGGRGRHFEWRLLFNGRTDEIAWERGFIDNSLSLDALREKVHVNRYVEGHPEAEGFSRRIRPGR